VEPVAATRVTHGRVRYVTLNATRGITAQRSVY
jgi:hypothetical protein